MVRIVSGVAVLGFLLSIGPQVLAKELVPEPSSGQYNKKIVQSKTSMVVTANRHASNAAKKILEQGGSAMDAGIAAQMVLNLVEPQSSGIGGGGFLLYWDNESKTLVTIDGRETSPKAFHKHILAKKGVAMEFRQALESVFSVGTPGLLHMLDNGHKRFGKLPWKTNFESAITLAENGFAISPRLHNLLTRIKHPKRDDAFTSLYYKKENVKAEGEILKNPDFADSLRRIAKGGIDVFYQGAIAKDIERALAKNAPKKGYLTSDDLKHYRSLERTALCYTYRAQYKVCSFAPPSSGGVAVLQSLAMLDHVILPKDTSFSYHMIAEVLKRAFADRNTYIADPAFMHVDASALLHSDYVKARVDSINQKKIKAHRAKPGVLDTIPSLNDVNHERPSTTHMSIVDQWGNALSMTTSIEFAFGSGRMVNGFLLNNQLTDFSFETIRQRNHSVNAPAANKRPRSSMAPIIVFNKDGSIRMVLGSPGGSRIIPYVLQRLIAVLDWDMSLQDAINAPHLATLNFGFLELEKGRWSKKHIKALQLMGHRIKERDLNSGLHGIELKGGYLISGTDPRREGLAIGD